MTRGFWSVIAASILIEAAALLTVSSGFAQKASPTQRIASSLSGKRTFAARCAGCHGLDGRGSERGANLANDPNVRRKSDAELVQVISNGIPNFGMPAFRLLGQSQIKEVVGFLRTLQRSESAASFPGDPKRGKATFFGNGGCANCHMISGQGGFLASNLSTYGQSLSASDIRKAIVEPGTSTQGMKTATALLRNGQRVSGVVRNEDNFSVQILDSEGKFHFLLKSELQSLQYVAGSGMPTNHGQQLSTQELNDLINYLHNVRANMNSQVDTVEE